MTPLGIFVVFVLPASLVLLGWSAAFLDGWAADRAAAKRKPAAGD